MSRSPPRRRGRRRRCCKNVQRSETDLVESGRERIPLPPQARANSSGQTSDCCNPASPFLFANEDMGTAACRQCRRLNKMVDWHPSLSLSLSVELSTGRALSVNLSPSLSGSLCLCLSPRLSPPPSVGVSLPLTDITLLTCLLYHPRQLGKSTQVFPFCWLGAPSPTASLAPCPQFHRLFDVELCGRLLLEYVATQLLRRCLTTMVQRSFVCI